MSYFQLFMSFTSYYNMQNNLSPNYLPIAKYKSIIAQLIAKNPVTVISGKTGCGKSTQIPQYILSDFPGAKIAICQPRRIAATSLAVRVSEEMGSKLGRKVGYHVGMQYFRQQNCSIVYMTYGILIQQLLFHETLKFTHVILDQIHERSLQMDFTFVAMKNILNTKYKDKIKLIIMSATLNSDEFAQYFATDQNNSFFIPQIIPTIKQSEAPRRGGRQRGNRSNIIEQSYALTSKSTNFKPAVKFELNEQKQFKVFQYFLDDIKSHTQFYQNVQNQQFISQDAYRMAIDIIFKQRNTKDKCDILVFVPGLFEIRTLKKQLQKLQVHPSQIIEVHSLFSEELYSKLFDQNVVNKIILATNIGQSSITLPFCKIVIDFCLSRKNFSKSKGITRLETRLASQASLTQRSGRVGRVSDGVVYRMISRDLYQALPQYQKPEIQCVSLEMVILKVKQMDTINQNSVFKNPYNFLMMTISPPEIGDIKQALNELIKEDALIGQGEQTSSDIQNSSKLSLTQVGMFMVSMPCDLQISKMMLMGLKIGIPFIIIRIASILMCTKTFFVHEERRFCMQNFMHYLIQYDNQKFNDYLLRQRMYSQWRNQFYQKFKKNKKKQSKSKQMNLSQQSTQIVQKQSLINMDREQNQQIANILQDFNHQKWSEQQLKWCKYRGINLNAMRQIIRIQEGIKLRLSSFKLRQDNQEIISNQLILLCLNYGFPFNDLQVTWKDSLSLNKKNGSFQFQLPYDQDYDIPLIHDYLHPEKDYKVTNINNQKVYLIQGNSAVISKFILPPFYSGKFDQTSHIFYHLNKKKILHPYKSQILYKRTQTSIFSDSINKACIPLKSNKNYRLLTHRFTEIKYKKMVSMCALIEEEMLHRMKLITMKEVKIALHPSKQFYAKYKIQDATYEFKSFVGEKQINMIMNMRKIARRQKNNQIYSSQQQMSAQDIQLLLNLITKDTREQHREEPWQYYYLIQSKIDINYTFYLIQNLPALNKGNSYYKGYQQWKAQYYYNFLKFYRCLVMEYCHLICGECYPKEIKQIEQIRKFVSKDNKLMLNQYSGSWKRKKEQLELYCGNDHLIGTVLNEDQAIIDRTKVKIYMPFRIVEELWEEWPTQEEIMMRVTKGKQLIQQQKFNINSFQCYFCYSYKEEAHEQCRKEFHKSQLKHNFWKKVMQHFRNYAHMTNLKNFCLSIEKGQQS